MTGPEHYIEAERLLSGRNSLPEYDAQPTAEDIAAAQVHATLAAAAGGQPVAEVSATPVPVALSIRLRELHYSVDGSPSDDGSCPADGCDWPCPTMTALYAAEGGASNV